MKSGAKSKGEKPGTPDQERPATSRRLTEPERASRSANKPADEALARRDTAQPPDSGANRSARPPAETATGSARGAAGAAAWGHLPDYIKTHRRGSMPEVPAKYRKYLEALSRHDQRRKASRR